MCSESESKRGDAKELSGSSSSSVEAERIDRIVHVARDCEIYLMEMSFKSKISSEFAGIPGMDLLPYASLAGMVMRRSPPTAMPWIPISQPLMTLPSPSLKPNGLPFLLAVSC